MKVHFVQVILRFLRDHRYSNPADRMQPVTQGCYVIVMLLGPRLIS